MRSPVDVFRELRASNLGEPRRRPVSVLEWIALAVLIGGGLLLIVRFGPWLAWWLQYLRWKGGRLALMVAMAPPILIGVAIKFAYGRWRERGIVPFAFPVIFKLPRWRIYCQDGDEALFLVDGRGLICLTLRSAPREALEVVLDALDPDRVLETDDETSSALAFELPPTGDQPGERPAFGVLRRTLDPCAYVFVIGDREELLHDLSGIFERARFRGPTEPPQKWRPIEAPYVTPARVRVNPARRRRRR